MRSGILLFSCLLILSVSSFAQQGIGWMHCIGGSNDDLFRDNVITRNGLIISIGYTLSNNGDVSGNHGGYDVLLVATNMNGAIQWSRVIGGTGTEGITGLTIDTVTDGNIVIGFSSESNNGDISGNNGPPDIVFRKYTTTGTLIWSKTYGGTNSESIGKLCSTPDGGIICAGLTRSHNTGNVGANHSTLTDIWVLKLDVNGGIEWQKCYGGTLNEAAPDICLAPGGGYYLSAETESTDGDMAGLLPGGFSMGAYDIWMSKISPTGQILWKKLVGGNDIDDGPKLKVIGSSLYLTFSSYSNDRNIPTNAGGSDICLFKYSLNGDSLFQKIYGSFSLEYSYDIISRNDGLIYLPSISYGKLLGPFSFPNPGSTGGSEALILTCDSSFGNLLGLKSFGGSGRDAPISVKLANSGDFIISGSTESNDYDMFGNHGGYDGFVAKIMPENRISGLVFIDRNANGVYDVSDNLVNYLPMETTKSGLPFANNLTYNGLYYVSADTGVFVTRPKPQIPAYFSFTPDSVRAHFTANYQSVTTNIKLTPISNRRDLRVFTCPTGEIRLGRPVRYLLIGQNVGTETVTSGSIGWKKDSRVSVTGYSKPPSFTGTDSLVWNFSDM